MPGLLSLNVHEPLQFEGTEICLHPNIFQSTIQSGDSISNTPRPSLSSISLATGKSNTNNNESLQGGIVQTSSSASADETKPPLPMESSKLLQVGDLIEIRVWDPLQSQQQIQQQQRMKGTPSTTASFLRKRLPHHTASPLLVQQQQQQLPLSVQSTSSLQLHSPTNNVPSSLRLETSEDSLVLDDEQKGEAPDTAPRKGPLLSPRKLEPEAQEEFAAQSKRQHQLSEEQNRGRKEVVDTKISDIIRSSPAASPTGEGNKVTAAAAATTSRPPVAPRSKSSSTANLGAPSSAWAGASGSKPLVRKSSPEISPPPPPPPPSAAIPLSPSPSSMYAKTRHNRDISDMTTDTTLFSGIGDGARRPSMDNDRTFHILDSPTEDEDDNDDLWTQVSSTHSLRLSFVYLVTEKSLKSLKASSRTHISILRQVADLYRLTSYDMVTVHKLVGREAKKAIDAVSADFVVVTIKDQYLSRGDLHFFQSTLIGSWIYEGQRLFEASRGIHANAREIRHGGAHASSGIVTENTTIAFRSRSSRIFWLVQLSAEMWDFAAPFQASQDDSYCEIYFDKFIAFIYDLFQKWKKAEVTHSLTVVFFSRTFLTPSPRDYIGKKGASVQTDIYGRHFEDHCRIVFENETRTDWDSLIVRIKEAFFRYPSEVGWNVVSGAGARRPSTAGQGNLLETVNVTLNLLQYHYLDRDLHRTGNSIVIVSAGNGVFEVDKKLAKITYQRMMDNGIGSDMLSLGLPPLHIAPFFLYFNEFQEVESEIPHWIHLSFVSYESDENLTALDNAEAQNAEQSISVGEIQEHQFDIGPNGFLRPQKRRECSKTPRAVVVETQVNEKTFSPQGNKLASPIGRPKSQAKEKQLEDRDFRDILEACRPRGTGVLPKALKSLLEMYSAGETKQGKSELSGFEQDGKETTIREWDDDMNLNELKQQNPLLLASLDRKDQPSPLISPLSPVRHDERERLEALSLQPASYTSQASHGPHPLLSTSYERHYLANDASLVHIGGNKMQRAPSLILDAVNDCIAMGSHESISDKSQTDDEEDADLIDSMRIAMRRHDQEIMEPMVKSPKAVALADFDRTSHSSLTPSRARSQGNTSSNTKSLQGSAGGGIGAALSRYSNTSQMENTATMSRTQSAGRLAPPFLTIGEHASQGLSPLILPPPTFSAKSYTDNPYVPNLGQQERRFFRPQIMSVGAQISSSPEPTTPSRATPGQHDNGKSKKPISPGQDPRMHPSASSLTSLKPKSRGRASPVSPGPDRRVQRPRSGSEGNSNANKSHTNRRIIKDAPTKSKHATRKRKPINPFRQQDEDEVLAKKNHNSRRWSHVFPLGEIEFKKKSGPNWKSLSAPAILPLTVDYFPPAREREHNYTFSLYNVTLSEFERNNFSTNKELLLEMVRQRITQDYQYVPDTVVDDAAENRRSIVRLDENEEDKEGMKTMKSVRMYLSIGHRLQVLHYDPSSDTVEVKTYMAKNAQGNHVGTFHYIYKSFCQETGSFVKVAQDFKQYNSPYNWSKVDRIICGDDDREMREGMRFKRIMFAILPPKHKDIEEEKAYVEKFKKLLGHFEKLRAKEETKTPLSVTIETSQSSHATTGSSETVSTPGIAGSAMVRFYVPLRKGGREQFEYLEISIDSTLNTTWSYRIILNWLVASSGKVDTHVQSLQRRCLSFGLNLVPSLEVSVSQTMFLNPFKAPAIFTIRDRKSVVLLDNKLAEMDFIHDGAFLSSRDFVDCLEQNLPGDGDTAFDFGTKWGKPPVGRQVIHRSGVLFVRINEDRAGKAVVFAFSNHRYVQKEEETKAKCQQVFDMLNACLAKLSSPETN